MLSALITATLQRWRSAQSAAPASSHVVLTSGANIAIVLLSLLTSMLLARTLGPGGRGELSAIQTWVTFIATLAMLGLSDGLVYFSARDPTRAGRYVGSAVSLALVTAPVFFLAGYLLMPHLLRAQSPDIVSAARWYLLLIPLWAAVMLPLHVLRGAGALASWNAVRLLQTLGWLAVLAVAALWGRVTATSLSIGHLLMTLCLAVPIYGLVRRSIRGPFTPDPKLWPAMLRFGVPAAGVTVPQALNLRLDQLLMAMFLPPQLLGLYVVAVAWSGAMAPLINAVGAVVFPRVASEQSSTERARLVGHASRLGGLSAVLVGAALAATAPIAIPLLFGAEFVPAIPAALVLVGATAIAAVNLILEEALRGLGEPKAVLIAELVGVACAAGALALLLPRWGIMGAAVGSVFSYSVTLVVLVVKTVRSTRCTAAEILIPTRNDIRVIGEHAVVLLRSQARG